MNSIPCSINHPSKGTIWSGNLQQIPSVGDSVCIEQKKSYPLSYTIKQIIWGLAPDCSNDERKSIVEVGIYVE